MSAVDLAVIGAEIVTVIGPSESGKSTLLRTPLRIIAPSHGTASRRDGLTADCRALFGDGALTLCHHHDNANHIYEPHGDSRGCSTIS